MNFEEKNINENENRGFYLVLVLCVLAVAAVAFAINNAFKAMPELTTEENTVKNETIQNNDIPQNPEAETPVTAEVKDEEYEKEEEMTAKFFVYPVAGEIVKNFSGDNLVYSETFKDFRYHSGMDIVPSGSMLVSAAGDGTVTDIIENTDYGTVIEIDHGNGVKARYCGVKNIKVKEGDKITANTPIAEIGIVENESADQAHLHFEMYKDGVAVSPAEFFENN